MAIVGFLSCLPGDSSQANPNQHGASDVIALNPRLSALAALDPGELLSLSMKLLNLPAQGTRLLRAPRDVLSQVVRHDRVRAMGGHRNAEQLYLVLFGKPLDLDDLSVRSFALTPTERIDMPVSRCAARVIDQAIALQWAVIDLANRFDEQHQLLRRVPRIHEHGAASQLLVMDHIGQHIAHMIELGQAIVLRVVNPVIDDPVLSGIQIHIHTRHDADAFDNPVLIAAVLPPHQLDLAPKNSCR